MHAGGQDPQVINVLVKKEIVDSRQPIKISFSGACNSISAVISTSLLLQPSITIEPSGAPTTVKCPAVAKPSHFVPSGGSLEQRPASERRGLVLLRRGETVATLTGSRRGQTTESSRRWRSPLNNSSSARWWHQPLRLGYGYQFSPLSRCAETLTSCLGPLSRRKPRQTALAGCEERASTDSADYEDFLQKTNQPNRSKVNPCNLRNCGSFSFDTAGKKKKPLNRLIERRFRLKCA